MVDAGTAWGIALVFVGLVLFALELIHPGAFLLIPGSIIMVAGFMYIFIPDFLLGTVYGPAIVVVAAAVAAVVEIPFYRYIAPVHRPMATSPYTLAGEEGIVVSPIVPDSLKGKVRVRSEVWSARSKVAIPAGARVRVLGGEGVSVEVAEIEPTAGARA